MSGLLIAGICGHGLIISPAIPVTPQTGKMVFPQLYMANGMREQARPARARGHAGLQDHRRRQQGPQGPITEFTDFGVAGDLHAVVPAVTGAIARGR